MNEEQIDKLIRVLKRTAIDDGGEWFNFEVDKHSGLVYWAGECSLEVITFDELIDRLS